MSRPVAFLSFLSVCLAAPGLVAQVEPQQPTSVDALEAAAGEERWYGIHAHALNVGALHLAVEEPEQGGARVTTRIVYPEGSPNRKQEEVFEVGPDGMLRSYRGVREDLQSETSFAYEPAEGGAVRWRIERRARPPSEDEGGLEPVVEDGRFEAVAAGSIPFFALPVVLERLDWSERAVHELSILPPVGIGEMLALSVTALGTEEIEHRGRAASAVRVRATVAEAEETYDFLIADGKVVEITGSKEPLRFVLGTPEEAAANLDVAESEEERGLKGSGLEFLVAVVLADEGALDRLVDFEAMSHRHHGEVAGGEAVRLEGEEDFRSRFLERIRGQDRGLAEPEIRARLEAVIPAFYVRVDGDAATLLGPGETRVLEFERRGDGWKVVWWNQLAGLLQ